MAKNKTTTNKRKDISNLKALGLSAQKNKSSYQFEKPNKLLLEAFDNIYSQNESVITFHTTEGLQSLCPLTGQPDSCRNLWVQYIPDKKMIESKSLKLYMNGYRNFGCFHEEICHRILNDLYEFLEPKWIKVLAEYEPRGGYAIIPCIEKTRPGYQISLHIPNIPLTTH